MGRDLRDVPGGRRPGRLSKVLDATTGELLLSEKSVVQPRASEAEVRAALAGHALTLEDFGQAWKWLRVARVFSWGAVGASFDPRSGGSTITLRYA